MKLNIFIQMDNKYFAIFIGYS